MLSLRTIAILFLCIPCSSASGVSVHLHGPDSAQLAERVERLESQLSSGQQLHEKSFTLTEAFIQRSLSEQEEYRNQLEAKYELLHAKYEFLEKKHDSFISDQNAEMNQEESASLQLKDNYALLQKQLEDTRNWTDSIITFWMTISGLLATIFGIGIPLITQRKYESKLQNMVSKEIEFLDLKARSMITDNKTEKMKFYDQMIEMQPSSFQVYTMRADLFLELDSYQDAIRDYEHAVELVKQDLKSPIPKTSHKDLSYIYWQRGKAASHYAKFKEATDCFDLALELTPKDPQILLSRGHTYNNIGDKEKALVCYRAARRYSQYRDYNYCMCSGHEAVENGEYVKAVDLFSKAIDLSPKSVAAWCGRGFAYAEKKDFKNAQSDYSKAIELNSKTTVGYINRGNLYSEQGEMEKAIVDYDKAIDINPQDEIAHINRGLAHSKKDDYIRALADYNKAIVINPKNAITYYNRGNLYLKQGDKEKVLADYDKAIALEPNYVPALKNRAELHEMNGNFEDAIKDYEAILSINPDDGESSYQLQKLKGRVTWVH